jgi:hypothetical protein
MVSPSNHDKSGAREEIESRVRETQEKSDQTPSRMSRSLEFIHTPSV